LSRWGPAAAVTAAAAWHKLPAAICSGLVTTAPPTIGAIAKIIQLAGGHHAAASPAVVAGKHPDFELDEPCLIDDDGDRSTMG
jgi:hypothetical protein